MIYQCLEAIKLAGWAAVIAGLIATRRRTDINLFWLKLVSSVMMMAGGAHDIANNLNLDAKSLVWFFADTSIITTYLYSMIREFLGKKKSDYHMSLLDEDIEEIKKGLK